MSKEIKPITLQELLHTREEFVISDRIITYINKVLLQNASNYAYIGAEIEFEEIFEDTLIYHTKESIKNELARLYKDFYIGFDNRCLTFSKR